MMSINPFITSHIDDIYLDSDNPRHDSISEQQDIIKHLVTTEEIKIENLAKDIIKLGMISPIEVIATIKVEGEENKYIVVEGNRRICSLKLLNDIDKSPLSHKQNFENILKKATNIPHEVMHCMFGTRKDADIWIERRHQGKQGGIGTVPWSAQQNAVRQSRKLLTRVLIGYASQIDITPNILNNSFDIVNRYFSNPDIRQAFGIYKENDNITVLCSENDFNERLSQFFADRQNKILKAHASGKDKKDYANHIIETNGHPIHVAKPFSLHGNATNLPNQKRAIIPPKKKVASIPNIRNTILPKDMGVEIEDPNLRKISYELKKLSCEKHNFGFPYASTNLLRTFLENTYIQYYEKVMNKRKTDTPKMKTVLVEIINHIKNEQQNLTKEQKDAFKNWQETCKLDHILSFTQLNHIVHGGKEPNGRDYIREWDNVQEIIVYLIRKSQKTSGHS